MLLIMGGLTSLAAADSFTFSLAGNYFLGGDSVSEAENAKVTITSTGAGGADPTSGFDIKVVNYQADPESIKQVLSSLQFNLKNNVSLQGLSLSGASGTIRTISSTGSYSDKAATGLGSDYTKNIDWGMVKSGSTITLCAGGYPAGCPSLKPQGIIGAAGAGNKYNGSPSLVVGTHTPELYGTDSAPVTFHLYSSSVTASTAISNVFSSATFTFGTNAANTVTVNVPPPSGGGGDVPEPASVALLGSGIAALAGRLRRKK
jgi:hypothetical protein